MKKTFTNSENRDFPVRGLTYFELAKIDAAWDKEYGRPVPVIPTYQVQTVTGEKQIIEHNEKSLMTDEDKAAWADYQASLMEYTAGQYKKRLQAAILCLEVKPMDDAAWVKRMKRLGIDLPEDEYDLLELYAGTEVLRDAAVDPSLLLIAVQRASSAMSEEVANVVEAMFRGQKERPVSQ